MTDSEKIADEQWHAQSAEFILQHLRSSASGLTADTARQLLARYGRNVLTQGKSVSALRVLANQLYSVVVLLLVVAAAASLFVGETIDAVAIAAVLVINVAIGFVTEIRAQVAMSALMKLDTPRALVVREGKQQEIDAAELVPGDVIRIEEGQSVPADARILTARNLKVAEAALTGESLPVLKRDETLESDVVLAERVNMLYKGTTALSGSADAVIVSTGMRTEVGRIGGMVADIKPERTPVERRLDSLGRRLAAVAVLAGLLMVAVGVARGFPMSVVLQTAVALAIAAVPEGLPAVATIALAVGMRRMARRKALVRRPPAVETLGSVTVICTDKTGTLTAGEMSVRIIDLDGERVEIEGSGYDPEGTFSRNGSPVDAASDEHLREAIRIGALVNRAELKEVDGGWTIRGDPTDAAFLVAAKRAGEPREQLSERFEEVAEIPFTSDTMLMASVRRLEDGTEVTCVKGSPGAVLERATMMRVKSGEDPMTDELRERVWTRNEELASEGLRVIALARRNGASSGGDDLNELTFVALAGLIDPPAAGVQDSLALFGRAGIHTVMITGDQQLTASAIARELGITKGSADAIDGTLLSRMTDNELATAVRESRVFSRVSPADKLAIIAAFRENGEIVAMLGDGVNDAAALRKADVGVAMGIRGTDAAKEASAIILQDDRFSTIAAAIEEGRVVFDNIRKFVFYLFSCNLAEVMVLIVAVAAGLPLPLLPLQILWLNLVTDTFPALSLAMEPAEEDVMNRPPRDPDRAILSGAFAGSVTFYASLIAASAFAAFLIGLSGEGGESGRAVTLCFMTLALAQAFHLGNARGSRHVLSAGSLISNPYAVAAVLLVAAMQVAAVHVGPLAAVLGTVEMSLRDWAMVIGLSVVPAVVGQLLRLVRKERGEN